MTYRKYDKEFSIYHRWHLNGFTKSRKPQPHEKKKRTSYNANEKLHQGAYKKIMQERYEYMARSENASYRANGEALFLEFPGKWEIFLEFPGKWEIMLTSEKNGIYCKKKDKIVPSSSDRAVL